VRSLPIRYWTMCHKLAQKLIGQETPRWENYVLMETIHCFYNRERDLNRRQTAMVAQTCFIRHTRSLLMFLRPKNGCTAGVTRHITFLGNTLDADIQKYEFCGMTLTNTHDGVPDTMRIPVMRHPHPSAFCAFEADSAKYEAF